MLEIAYDSPGTRGIYLWPDHKDAVFPGAGAERMTGIRATMNSIRHFRNRVFHHEPIWSKSTPQPSPNKHYGDILAALRWLGSPHRQRLPRLHDPLGMLDSADALVLARARLLQAIDSALNEAERKRAEREAKPAVRRVGESP